MWVERLFCLKHGQPGFENAAYGSSGIIIKAHGGEEPYYDSSSGTTLEQKGRETLTTQIAGQSPKVLRQPKFIESEEEKKKWEEKAKNIEEMTNRILMGNEPQREFVPAQPDEKHLWEGLKKANTGAEVRKIVKKSRFWLIWRINFPSGKFIDWGWHGVPKALYDHADKFCEAKLDPRYPGRDKRETADYWRIEYFARVLAGLSLVKPLSPSYSVEVLRRIDHLQQCFCWRCRLQIRPRFLKTLAQHLRERAQKEKDIARVLETR